MIIRFAFLLIISFSVLITEAQENLPINVSSFNLRYDTRRDRDNAWPNRRDFVMQLIRYHEFDIIGTQELLFNQIEDLTEMEEFAYVGGGRDDGLSGGEHSTIFFKTDRFGLLDYGDFWLSETPDIPSRGWDAALNRICTWVKLKDFTSGDTLFVFNAHYDHRGSEARIRSSALVRTKIEEIANGYPVIFTTDLNSTPGTEPYNVINSFLYDAYDITELPPYGPVGTFNGFDLNAPLNSRIDFVFVSEHFRVHKYGALTDFLNGRFPSDHLPVVVRVTLR
ncbi:endonuclease/exonuclease/phosphatase family protein [Natronoflexus pectinivorans]|uniref:Endonuclease/exonuclease/phosphatase family metal-dependent hydrolase n=1 Tax=Natronoflexus pectinivorans TaxID=682526 RepID=A0A4R2GNK9_9BACT|nr:endonuclease/exonuclease/phosphatase family protein [Natronoflexus pectinivorans]TCO10617.1 endonuclease/exonuclease/phosphatase family metal-dependent hydrolase [Natronoflexus pectinivorans]